MLRTAVQAKVPKDQLLGFLERGYVPYPWQMTFHGIARMADLPDGPVDIGVGGARGPGKSHAVFEQVIDDCKRIPGLKALFLRQTGKAASESFEDLIFKTLAGRLRYEYNSSKNMLRIGTSRVLLGGFENEKDIDKYVGIEYDLMAVEEMNQLTKAKIDRLKGSLRTSKPNWRPRIYSSFNPGGQGHAFVKETYVLPYRLGTETKTRFIPSNYRQNPSLNKEYVEYLEGLEGDLGRAWRDGDFDLFEGQYFSEWRHEKHVIKPFEIPQSYRRYRSYDHGRAKPASCGWYAVDYDGRVFKYKEFYRAGLNVDELALEINRRSHDPGCLLLRTMESLAKAVDENEKQSIINTIMGGTACSRLAGCESYEYSVADPAIFANTGMVDKFGGQTIAETFARNGVTFMPASNRRVDGWNLVHQYLAGDPPKLQFFETCTDAVRTFPMLQHDELRPEDVDTDGEDHAPDETRYLLTSLHETKSPKPLNDIERKLEQAKKQMGVRPNNLNKFYGG